MAKNERAFLKLSLLVHGPFDFDGNRKSCSMTLKLPWSSMDEYLLRKSGRLVAIGISRARERSRGGNESDFAAIVGVVGQYRLPGEGLLVS